MEEKLTLDEIAQRRGLTFGTILNHLEKLKARDNLPDIDHLKPAVPDGDFEQLVRAFDESEDGRLTPVRERFGGSYSFDDLRIIRLFAR